MSLSLWRHEEVGIVPLSRQKQDVRYGRRQNALLLTGPAHNRFSNSKLDAGALNWTLAGAGATASVADILPPFGAQPLELVRTDALTGDITLNRNVTLGGSELPNGSRKGHLGVWVNAPVGTQFKMVAVLAAIGGDPAQTISFTQTVEKPGWNRLSWSFTPATTTQTVMTLKFGITGTYMGPVYLNAASFYWNTARQQAYIDTDYGAFNNGGAIQSVGTDVVFDIPGDTIRANGSLAFWYNRVDGTVSGTADTIATILKGTTPLLQIDVVNSFTTVDQVSISTPTTDIYWDVKGLTGVDEWNHYLFTWDQYGKWTFFLDGAQQPINLQDAAKRITLANRPDSIRFGRDQAASNWGNGLLEGFTIYDRKFVSQEAQAIFKSGDNLQTGALLHLGLWSGQPLLELGECVGFMDTGDYRVQPGGYVPGAASAMPTVRYEQNQQAVGPYIVAERTPSVVETITFSIGKDTASQRDISVSAKFAKLKELVSRSATQQRLCLTYSPLRAKRNVRAYVRYASVTPGPGWTGVEQVVDRMNDVKVDLERESEFSDPVHRLGTMNIQWSTPFVIPDVPGSSPAPMAISSEQMPGNFYLGLRRLKLPKTPIYLLSSTSVFDWTALGLTVSVVGREAGTHMRWSQLAPIAPTGKLGDWNAPQIGDRANFGNYRVLMVAKLSAVADVTAWVRIGDSIVTGRPTTSWQAIDMGNISVPGKNVRHPGLHEVTNQVVQFGLTDNSGGATYTFDLDFVVLIPVDDGFAQVLRNSDVLTYPILLDGETGDVTAEQMLNAYTGGLALSPTVPTELRVIQLDHSIVSGNAIYDYSQGGATLLYIEYIPKWSGLGDVP